MLVLMSPMASLVQDMEWLVGEIQWDVQYNVNYNGNPPWGGGGVGGCGSAQARYPSSLASEEYPYAIYFISRDIRYSRQT